MEDVFKFLNERRTISQPCLDDLYRITKPYEVRRKQIILRPGQINSHLYFIKKGVLHCYSKNGNKEVPDWFFWENHLAVSVSSFYHQKPSIQYIVAEEDTELYYITWEQYEWLCHTYGEFSDIARQFLQDYFVLFHGYLHLLREKSAEERYAWVLAKMPDLLDRIPQKYTAPWMGMSPETLSRLRGKRP